MSEGKRDRPHGGAVDQAETAIDTARQEISPASEVSESRRRFTKAGLLLPPVLMSVASRPVFGTGTPCISNMLSGNLSHPSRGSCEAVMGFTRKDVRVGAVDIITDLDLWNFNTSGAIKVDSRLKNTPPNYPIKCGKCKTSGIWDPAKCGNGTAFNSVFTMNGVYENTTTDSMYRILCTDFSNVRSYFITALLNTYLTPNYVLTRPQLIHVWNGDIGYPHIGNIKRFLRRTWNGNWQGTW